MVVTTDDGFAGAEFVCLVFHVVDAPELLFKPLMTLRIGFLLKVRNFKVGMLLASAESKIDSKNE